MSYFSGEVLRECLASIPAAAADGVHVVVVDNSTTDGGDRAIVEQFPFARYIDSGANLGYGRAVNLAAESLDDEVEWILVTNPDTVFFPGSIDTLHAAAAADASIGSIGPRILDTDGTIYPSARNLPSIGTGVGHALLAHVWPTNPWSAKYRRSDSIAALDHGSMPSEWLSGACVMVRRTAFEALGGFDERYFMYFEDVQMGDSLGRAGWTNLYLADAVVSHIGGHSTRLRSSAMSAVHHASAYTYLSSKYSAWYLAPVRVALRIGIRIRLALIHRSQR